jgi:hypothetical protein
MSNHQTAFSHLAVPCSVISWHSFITGINLKKKIQYTQLHKIMKHHFLCSSEQYVCNDKEPCMLPTASPYLCDCIKYLASYLHVCLLGLLFNPKDGGSMFLENISKLLPEYTVSHHRRKYPSHSLMWEPQITHNECLFWESCKTHKYALSKMQFSNTVKPRFIVSVRGPEKERWIRENDRCGGPI